MEKMMSLSEMAERLGLQSGDGLRRQVLRGALQAQKIGKIWVVTEEEVERYRIEQLGQRGKRNPAPGRKTRPPNDDDKGGEAE